jgi:hypothetical protein
MHPQGIGFALSEFLSFFAKFALGKRGGSD